MHKFIAIVILLFSIIYQSNALNYNEKDTLNVFALNGLNIRLESHSMSDIIGQAKYGESLVVENVFDFSLKDTIDARVGHWVQINYNGIQGCVFDGYISKLPVPKLKENKDDPYVQMNHYINSNFHSNCEPIEIFEPWFDGDGKDGASHIITDFGNNIKQIETSGYEDFEDKLYFENTRFSEIISLFEIFVSRDEAYQKAFVNAKQQFKPSVNISRKSKKNSTIEVLKFTLTDGIKSKKIKFSSEG